MKKTSAFSLIELSIVILVIGILIAGVTQSSSMLKKSMLNSARSLTKSSPVVGIPNLMLWYETSLETSFDSSAQTDGSSVATWYDNNPQSSIKIDANGSKDTSGIAYQTSYQPLFIENVFNGGIPAVRFDGIDDCLPFDGSSLVASSYTIFVVEQKRAATGSFASFIGGTTNANGQNLFFGYYSDSVIRLTHFTYTLSYTSSSDLSYSNPRPRIHSGRFDSSSSSASYWLNGISKTVFSTLTVPLISYTGSAIGRRRDTTSAFFNGDIAEIIIFTRALLTEERQSVETYLSKKYAINLK